MQFHRHRNRLLFILKRRYNYGSGATGGDSDNLSTGLYNSVQFIVDMLNVHNVHARLEVVNDNNDIDKVVTSHKPTHVFIEAFWVVPEKFDVLMKLHPHVQWIVRNHSDVPFLAMEGNSLAWAIEYLRRGVEVNSNTISATEAIVSLAAAHWVPLDVTYLPNFYPRPPRATDLPARTEGEADICCFGAIRPLKNQLVQALAALEFAQRRGLYLNFHINSSRIEGNAGAVLKNLRSVFTAAPRAQLVEHPWLPHEEFIDLLNHMNVAMQVSLSESFNIVTADAITAGVPVVVSNEIDWVHPSYRVADPTHVAAVASALDGAWARGVEDLQRQRHSLVLFGEVSETLWLNRFGRDYDD